MIRRLSAVAVLALLASTRSGADSIKPIPAGPAPRQIAEEAMNFVAADDMKGFIALVRTKMPMPPDELDKFESQLTTQRKQVVDKLGKGLGYLLVNECRRGDTLVRLMYAEKREKNLMRWQFIFYKPHDKWVWLWVYWDSDLSQLFTSCS